MSSLKRPGDETPHATPPAAKVQRTDDSDFANSVKKKLGGVSRTGQACDRCKVRKIRCDARPGGCSPCAQNSTECRTTDRITGRATSRGYTENIESENAILKQHLADLHKQLQEHGIEPRPQPALRTPIPDNLSPASKAHPNDPHNLSRILNPEPNPKGRSEAAVLPEYRPDNAGDNYLGPASANDWPKPVGGLYHALFGMHIDFRDYVADDGSEMAKATSYSSFLAYVAAKGSVERPRMPPYHHCKTMFDFFFKMSGAWLPILHKPHIMDLLHRMYNDPTCNPTLAETVQIHLVLAAMLFQFAARNSVTPEHNWSDHYRYALSFFTELYRQHDLPSLQALAMVLVVMRAFPKPGAVWIASVGVLGKAVEMGLHRSVTAWENAKFNMDAHEIEMRKRVFWSILIPHITVGARLGRPFVVRLDDFDVELPELINDNTPEEVDIPEHNKCSFAAGLVGFKFLVVQLQMYSSLYTIRPVPQSYEKVQKKLSREIEVWFQSMPPQFLDEQAGLEDRCAGLYMDFGHQCLRLLLYHPSLLRKSDPELLSYNLDNCLDASSKLLAIAKGMRDLQLLDTTWFNSSYFIAAIFTTLFAYHERRDKITSVELKTLQGEMDQWVEIMENVGQLLGSGTRLANALRGISSSVIDGLARHVAAKTASAAYASTHTPTTNGTPSQQSLSDAVANASALKTNVIRQDSSMQAAHHQSDPARHVPGFNAPYPPEDNTLQPTAPYAPAGYQAQQPFYPDPATAIPNYAATNFPEHYPEEIKPSLTALPHHPDPQNQPTFYAPYPDQAVNNGSVAWRNFADNMASTMSTDPHLSAHWGAGPLMGVPHSPAVKSSPATSSVGLQQPQPQGAMHHPVDVTRPSSVPSQPVLAGVPVHHHPSALADGSGSGGGGGGGGGVGGGGGGGGGPVGNPDAHATMPNGVGPAAAVMYHSLGSGISGALVGPMTGLAPGPGSAAWPNMGLYAAQGSQ